MGSLILVVTYPFSMVKKALIAFLKDLHYSGVHWGLYFMDKK
jgi:hypothetical protein